MTEIDVARVVKGSAYLGAQSMATTIINVVSFAFIARILTQTEMGVTVALSLTVGIAALLADLGFSSGLTKHIAECRGRNVDYAAITFTGLLMKVSMASFIAVICALAAPYFSELLLKTAEYALLFRMLSVYLLFVCINVTMGSFLLGLNKIREIATLSLVVVFTQQTFAVALLLLGYGLVGLVTSWILGSSTYTILSTLMVIKGKHIKMRPIKEVATHAEMLAKFSWPLFLSAMVYFLYEWFDRSVLLFYIPLREMGVYSVAYKAFFVLSTMPGALGAALFPYYSEQYGKDKEETILASVRGATRYIALLYTPLALGLAVTANPTITLFAGSIYASGDVILVILSLVAAISGLGVAFGGLFLVYDMTPTILLINVVSVGVSLALSPVLLPSLGAPGMAIVKGAALIVSFVLSTVALRRRIPIKFDKEALWKSWGAAIVMFVIVWLVEQINFSPYLLPVYVLVGGATYAGSLRILKAINKNDLQLIRNLMGKHVASLVDVLEKVLI